MTTLIKGAQLLRFVGGEPRVAAADILVENDRIARIAAPKAGGAGGAATRRAERTIDGRGKLVIPGLINSHIHTYDRFDKGRFDGLPLELFLAMYNPPLGRRNWTPRECYLRTMLNCIEMIRSGTTTAIDDVAHGYPLLPENIDAVFQAYEDAGMRSLVSIRHSDRLFYEDMPYLAELLPEPLKQELSAPRSQGNAEVLQLLRRYGARWRGRVRMMLAVGMMQRCSEELLRETWRLSEELDLRVVVHVSESRAQQATARVFFGESLIERMQELSLLTPRVILAHAVWVNERDIRLVAASGASVVHNPISNLKCGSGIAPVRDMIEGGVNVALGTDNNNANDSVSMLESMKVAALIHKAHEVDYRRWVGARDAVRMATVNGARCAGLEGSTGSLEEGKQADLVIIDTDNMNFFPRHDLLNQLVFSENGRSIETVMIDGKIVFDKGAVTTVDEKSIIAELWSMEETIRDKIARATARGGELEPYVREAYWRCIDLIGR